MFRGGDSKTKVKYGEESCGEVMRKYLGYICNFSVSEILKWADYYNSFTSAGPYVVRGWPDV